MSFDRLPFGFAGLCQPASLHGRVTDETGAVLPGARVTLAGTGGLSKVTTSARRWLLFIHGYSHGDVYDSGIRDCSESQTACHGLPWCGYPSC